MCFFIHSCPPSHLCDYPFLSNVLDLCPIASPPPFPCVLCETVVLFGMSYSLVAPSVRVPCVLLSSSSTLHMLLLHFEFGLIPDSVCSPNFLWYCRPLYFLLWVLVNLTLPARLLLTGTVAPNLVAPCKWTQSGPESVSQPESPWCCLLI